MAVLLTGLESGVLIGVNPMPSVFVQVVSLPVALPSIRTRRWAFRWGEVVADSRIIGEFVVD